MRQSAAGVCASARITAARAPDGRTVLPELRGDGPLALRRIRSAGPGAHVCLVGAMSAPLGGDRLALDVTLGAGTRLHLSSAAATIALPGRTGAPASYTIRISVGADAELDWLPEPLIAAAGSRLEVTTRIDLAPTARLLHREELVLGRTGEAPGGLTSRLTVRRGGRLLLDQQTAYGPGHPGWDGPAGLAGRRAVGQQLRVDHRAELPSAARLLGEPGGETEGVCAPLAGPALLTTVLARDALGLRRALREGG
ncbi:urease accessory protein UreD [Streptomyces sp. NPDC051940]|uniref:urease accessory protein UreD n=1 Tax=Streptomyces sp. NPDC051940 TaxID=3155675 RepID=UPI00343435B6